MTFKEIFQKTYHKPRFYNLVKSIDDNINIKRVCVIWLIVAVLMFAGKSPYFDKFLLSTFVFCFLVLFFALSSKFLELLSIHFVKEKVNKYLEVGIGYSDVMREAERQGLI